MDKPKRVKNNWDIGVGESFDIPLGESRSKFAQQLVYAANRRGEKKYLAVTIRDQGIVRITRSS